MGEERTIYQDHAAAQVAKAPGAEPDEISFASKGNESDNSANQPDKKIPIAAVLLAVVVLVCAAFFGSYLVNASTIAPAQETGSNFTADANTTITAIYFYGEGCHHCE